MVVTNQAHDHHDTGRHPERPARLQAALDGLRRAAGDDGLVPIESRPATAEELATVHDPAYLGRLEAFCADGGGLVDHAPTPVSPGSWSTALRAAGAGLQAIEALDDATDGTTAGFVVVRPPGHHALPEHGMGFCLFNNIAVAATRLADRGERVLIFDWDVHHGNGTQAAFWGDPRVLFISFHQTGLYPGSGAAHENNATTINVPFAPASNGRDYLQAFEDKAAPAIEAFAPTWVLVSAGFDAHRDDRISDIQLTDTDFAALTRNLGAERRIFFLEGGYDLDAVRDSMQAVASAVLE
ncbi:MAG: hypothetical protein QOF60_3044 [Actinomycetota bacterium]|nr:hypothetical protein [Actinomycetota bacterium]